jgi:sulfite reductase (NADPH) flavoprotein alpha-component
MNKPLDTKRILSAVSLIPESAPFNVEQRAWLNGFFAGMTGMEEVFGFSGVDVGETPLSDDTVTEEEFPWHDDSLKLEERLSLAEDRPVELQLMAAMAQLNCGSCGYLCQSYSAAIASGDETNLTLCSPGGKETARAIKKLVKLNGDSKKDSRSSNPSVGEEMGWTRKNPFAAKLISNGKLTGEGSAKDVRHVEIDLRGSGINYNVGDALGVYPTNCPELMKQIADCCCQTGDDTGSLPTKDLSAVSDELAEWFIENLVDDNERKHAEAIAGDDELLDELDVLDFLQKFSSTVIPLKELAERLPDLNPRLYSIASSLKTHTDQVHLTVGKVTYEQNNRWRKGVASTMLADRVQTNDTVRVFIQAAHGFSVPQDPSVPMIMVGPGTGIAPFISFLQERDSVAATGDNWLFFGDQKSETDFLYRAFLEDCQTRGVLNRMDTAFSRDQPQKIYVQDRMREKGAELFQWLERGAYFFVCGDASRMAQDVDIALHEIVRLHGRMSADEAAEYVKQLIKESRYARDVY